MPQKINTPPRYMFWHEIAFAIKASNPRKVWDIDHIINEICRIPENSHHVPAPLIPSSEYGLRVEQLLDFVKALKASAEQRTETYTVRGVTRTRKQSVTKPIMLVGVASYPEPDMRDTAERRRWINLVVEAVKARVEADHGLVVSAVLHIDESHSHLHLVYVSSLPGSLVRSLHWGFRASDAEPLKSKKGEAYRAGCERIQEWFFESVGSKMGWLRKRVVDESTLDLQRTAPSPSRRPSRSQAQRNRQYQLETEAAALQKRNAELEKKAQELAVALAQHHENVTHFDADFSEGEEYFARRREEIDAEAEILRRERETVQSIKVEYESRKLRIEAEAAAHWQVIGEAVEKTKAWQEEVRDQLALEARVAKIRVKVRPGSAAFGAADQGDDLSDIPF